MEQNIEKIKSIYESVMALKVSDVKLLSENSLHCNYLITTNLANFAVLRLPKESTSSFQDFVKEYKITLKTQQTPFDIECYYFDTTEGVKITKYIATTQILNKDSSERTIENVTVAIKNFHNFNYNLDYSFNVIEKINLIKHALGVDMLVENEKEILNNFETVRKTYPSVFCHNYLLPTNILIRNNDIFFINYIFFGKNIALFDLAVMLTSCGINDKRTVSNVLLHYFRDSNDKYYRDYLIVKRVVDLYLNSLSKLSLDKIL
ncbi:MAG: hypothetical protein LBM99_02025 [Bacillales bacterium]|jgi:thiamine kinase-like enzyme|nr:hypothetical protein [Bacillales bacterium]